jgi:hypothetical protein
MLLTPSVMTVSRGTGGGNSLLIRHLFHFVAQNRLS